MIIENHLKLTGEDLKGAEVIGFCGTLGNFDFIQIKLKTGKNIELHPYKSGKQYVRIETIETVYKPNF
jgi:hypothetical protein